MENKPLGSLIKLINEKLVAIAEPDFEKLGVTFRQSMVLYELDRVGGQATQKELEIIMEVSHPTITGLVKRMEKNGFVITWFSGDDRRNKLVKLTPKAKGIIKELEEFVVVYDKITFKSFTPEEISVFTDMLLRIYENVK